MNTDSAESLSQGRESSAPRWLVLIHQVPPKPDYLRVKVRRRLRRVGARPLKNSVYVLPYTDDALEDFQWLAREIVAEGGTALVCEASFIEGISDTELAALFRSGAADRPAPGGGQASWSGRTWVTRRGVQIDRMASAWLIRRFIDPAAQFKFVAPRGYKPVADEVRFDMYDAEFTHVGAQCTFETLLERFGLGDRGLRAIAEIVHDIDCKDDRFDRPEAPGVALLLDGIARARADDTHRLERAAVVLDDVYAHFQSGR